MPKYFVKFPKAFYNNTLLTDIGTRIKISDKYINNLELYYEYTYQDTDTPEIIADKYYGDPELHWLILITNSILDPNFDFTVPYNVFSQYIESKYAYNGSRSPRTLKIENAGSSYTNGTYLNVPLTISNEDQLPTVGSGIEVNITISSNVVQEITVKKGGDDYLANTIFTVDSALVGGTGQDFSCSIGSFMTGLEYAKLTIEPTFGYEKIIKISDYDSKAILSKDRFTINKESYDNLYVDEPYDEIVTLGDGTRVLYQVLKNDPISIYDWENEKNESKRTIKLLKKEYLSFALDQFNTLMKK